VAAWWQQNRAGSGVICKREVSAYDRHRQARPSLALRRGAVQALVREAYQAAVAEQGGARRPPATFAQAWRANLAMFLDQSTVDLDGWGPISIADLDVDLAWKLFEAASDARQRAIEHATATRSRRVQRGQKVPTFEFAVTGDGVCRPHNRASGTRLAASARATWPN
jgi:hypothetical protein